jgi:hypothetical protein
MLLSEICCSLQYQIEPIDVNILRILWCVIIMNFNTCAKTYLVAKKLRYPDRRIFIFETNPRVASFMKKKSVLILLIIVLYVHPAIAQNRARFSNIVPGMRVKWIEQEAVRLANQLAGNRRCPEEYSKAKILSYDWMFELDKWGWVTGRKLHIELYAEFPDGHCGMADFIFREKLMPNDEFAHKLQFEKMGDMYTIDCE